MKKSVKKNKEKIKKLLPTYKFPSFKKEEEDLSVLTYDMTKLRNDWQIFIYGIWRLNEFYFLKVQ